MRRSIAIAAIPALVLLPACSSSPAASTAAPPAASIAPDATLGPLALGTFPSTTDGRLAKAICQAWAGLRDSYAAHAQNDAPATLNQWFSSPAWATVHADAVKLGNDPAFTALEAAVGVAMVGDTASIATAQNVDKACAAG